jgi:hypothetical protein
MMVSTRNIALVTGLRLNGFATTEAEQAVRRNKRSVIGEIPSQTQPNRS